MDTIVAKYQWNVHELTKAFRWHFRQSTRPIFRIAIRAILIFFCLAGAGILLAGDLRSGAIVGGIGLLWLILLGAAAPWSARLQFRHSPDKNAAIEFRLSPRNIQIITPRGNIQAEWSLLLKVAESPDGLLLYFAPQAFNWIPRSGFANDAEFAAAAELARKNCQTFVNCESPIWKGFRFTVQGLLWATFWVCIWAATLSHLVTFIKSHRPLVGLPWWTMLTAVWIPLFIIVWSPSVAIGALFNNARRGAVIGLIPVAVVVILLISIMI